jgi:type IV secretion system protein VirB1
MELMGCPALAVPSDVMQHVVHVESSFNPYAIGVVGGRLARQPRNLPEAVATARMLEARGFNFSLGLAQVNRYNLGRYGLASYETAFDACANLRAGARILAECHDRSGGNWGKAFSCYYSGNFVTGYRHGYVQKIFASIQADAPGASRYPDAIPLAVTPSRRVGSPVRAASRPSAAVRAVSAWSQRIVGEQPAAPAAAAAATASNATSAGSTVPIAASAPEPGVAVLDAAGGPPRVVATTGVAPNGVATAPSPAPGAPAAPADSAFVF